MKSNQASDVGFEGLTTKGLVKRRDRRATVRSATMTQKATTLTISECPSRQCSIALGVEILDLMGLLLGSLCMLD